jgi:Holliday junction resolvasome RuvABC endonuclease subunit
MTAQTGLDASYRVIGIDPGTENLGYSVLDLNLVTGEVTVSHSETIIARKMMSDYRHEEERQGGRYARLMVIEDRLFITFSQYTPQSVCAESPFLQKRFPLAYSALTECVTTVRRALYRYDPYLCLGTVDPPTAKKAVGVVIKKGMTKDDVSAAIAKLPLAYANGIQLSKLDEHQVDSIAVAYYQLLVFKNQIPIPNAGGKS